MAEALPLSQLSLLSASSHFWLCLSLLYLGPFSVWYFLSMLVNKWCLQSCFSTWGNWAISVSPWMSESVTLRWTPWLWWEEQHLLLLSTPLFEHSRTTWTHERVPFLNPWKTEVFSPVMWWCIWSPNRILERRLAESKHCSSIFKGLGGSDTGKSNLHLVVVHSKACRSFLGAVM